MTRAVADGLEAVVAEHRHAVAQFGNDTREDTLKRAAEKIRTTKFKLAAYSEYLSGERDRLDRAVADAERELRGKVELFAQRGCKEDEARREQSEPIAGEAVTA